MITKNTDDTQPPARTFFCFTDILIPLVKCQHMEMLEEGSINDSERKFVFKGLYKYYQFFFGKSTILGALWYGSCSLSGIFRRADRLSLRPAQESVRKASANFRWFTTLRSTISKCGFRNTLVNPPQVCPSEAVRENGWLTLKRPRVIIICKTPPPTTIAPDLANKPLLSNMSKQARHQPAFMHQHSMTFLIVASVISTGLAKAKARSYGYLWSWAHSLQTKSRK